MNPGMWFAFLLLGLSIVGIIGVFLIEAYFVRKEKFVDRLQSKVEESGNGTRR